MCFNNSLAPVGLSVCTPRVIYLIYVIKIHSVVIYRERGTYFTLRSQGYGSNSSLNAKWLSYKIIEWNSNQAGTFTIISDLCGTSSNFMIP